LRNCWTSRLSVTLSFPVSSSPSNVPIQCAYPLVVSVPRTWNWSLNVTGNPVQRSDHLTVGCRVNVQTLRSFQCFVQTQIEHAVGLSSLEEFFGTQGWLTVCDAIAVLRPNTFATSRALNVFDCIASKSSRSDHCAISRSRSFACWASNHGPTSLSICLPSLSKPGYRRH
jgi:hypothetical protein